MPQATLSKQIVIQERPMAAPVSSSKKAIRTIGRMSLFSRIVLTVLSLSMILAFFFPLWDIALDAPQYPEGLSIQIWLNQISGDLSTINALNHYIGMKHITP